MTSTSFSTSDVTNYMKVESAKLGTTTCEGKTLLLGYNVIGSGGSRNWVKFHITGQSPGFV